MVGNTELQIAGIVFTYVDDCALISSFEVEVTESGVVQTGQTFLTIETNRDPDGNGIENDDQDTATVRVYTTDLADQGQYEVSITAVLNLHDPNQL